MGIRGYPGIIPKKWERFADVAIIPRDSFDGPEWEPDEGLWQAVAGPWVPATGSDGRGLRRNARERVEMLLGRTTGSRGRREDGFRLLSDEDNVVEGNLEERARMGRATLPSEVCVDLYSG